MRLQGLPEPGTRRIPSLPLMPILEALSPNPKLLNPKLQTVKGPRGKVGSRGRCLSIAGWVQRLRTVAVDAIGALVSTYTTFKGILKGSFKGSIRDLKGLWERKGA